jgi:RNA ligase (TIGR02306 family)
MSDFKVPVVKVLSVEHHPDADRLSIIQVLGFRCISAKFEDGSHRYQVGDYVAYIPSASLLPKWMLHKMDFWNLETNKGTLSGPDGNRVKPLKLRGIFSEGVLYPVKYQMDEDGHDGDYYIVCENSIEFLESDHVNGTFGPDNIDVSKLLGITKYEPIIPVGMAGEVANMFGNTAKYDFERIESVPDIFNENDHVTATEKLHGTMVSIAIIPGLQHDEMFGVKQNILVHSKGLGAQGLAFKNNDANAHNLYVKTLNKLLSNGFEENIQKTVSNLLGDAWVDDGPPVSSTLRIFGEIYGPGVQDLHYGEKDASFRVFDIRFGDEWMDHEYMEIFCNRVGLNVVPLLYDGLFDLDALTAIRDGNTTLGGGNIREGIVVRKKDISGKEVHPLYGRKIAKMISPNYLLRKSKNQTEFQ